MSFTNNFVGKENKMTIDPQNLNDGRNWRSDARAMYQVYKNLKKEKYDRNAPFQRGKAWKSRQKTGFIEAVAKGNVVHPIYLIQKPDGSYTVLDGKQRLTTIEEFFDNQVAVKVAVDGHERKMKWKQIQEDVENLASILEEYTLDLCVCTDVTIQGSLVQQVECFQMINAGSPLSNHDHRYCPRMVLKKFLFSMVDAFFENVGVLFPKKAIREKHEDYQYLTQVHSLLVGAFGPSLKDSYAPRNLKSENMTNHADELEDVLRKMGATERSEFTPQFLSALGFDVQFKQFNLALEMVHVIWEVGHTKKVLKNNLPHLFWFFINKIQNNEITMDTVLRNAPEMYRAFTVDFQSLKITDAEMINAYKGNSKDASSIDIYHKNLNSIMTKVLSK